LFSSFLSSPPFPFSSSFLHLSSPPVFLLLLCSPPFLFLPSPCGHLLSSNPILPLFFSSSSPLPLLQVLCVISCGPTLSLRLVSAPSHLSCSPVTQACVLVCVCV